MYKEEIVNTRINSFASNDPVVEIPLSSLQNLLTDLVSIHNLLAETVQEFGILRGRQLSKITKKSESMIKATTDPIEKVMLINAYIKQHISRIRDGLKSKTNSTCRNVIHVASKIQARAVQIIDYIKNQIDDDPLKRKEVSLDSQQIRLLINGKEGEQVSRRDTIRAMRRVEKLWPGLVCDHRPGDGRRTMRLIGKVDYLKESPPDLMLCSSRQRWNWNDVRIMFNLT